MSAPVDLDLAARLFDELDRATRNGVGIMRPSYGDGENRAHEIVREAAAARGLRTDRDAALNLYMTLPGRQPELAPIVVGSHLDAVPQGGNFDGAAGVIAGLATVAGLKAAGITPRRDVVVMGIRAEESVWFNGAYIGTEAAFGRLPPETLAVRRADTGRTLAEHMTEAGGDAEAVRNGHAYLQPENIHSFVEVHIEQGPILEERRIPVGIVTGIRGCLRFADACCRGAYAHSGAEPRQHRRDAVAATVALIHRLNEAWMEREAAGQDLAFTVGQLNTDPDRARASIVPGETWFALDLRSVDDTVMQEMAALAAAYAEEISARHQVCFDLGEGVYSPPGRLAPELRRRFASLAAEQGVQTMEICSGAGHDAAEFAALGVPTAMLFIRNQNGSHNPNEGMRLEDFAHAATVLSGYLADER